MLFTAIFTNFLQIVAFFLKTIAIRNSVASGFLSVEMFLIFPLEKTLHFDAKVCVNLVLFGATDV
jgi:hypothetical protein